MKNEVMNALENVFDKVTGEWLEAVQIDNPNDNPLCEAYNEGANAMANKVKFLVHSMLLVEQIRSEGHTVTIEWVGGEQ